ncbi:hypothetical protein IPA_05420 [Ignicoccus pacificus DSM 13166]|uniref:MBL fold metallo-hydrolase n=1 Tax=Ignicoccus pacificus DSM 13166 TaxID=940294 RepID=A0A977PKZ2_9CREN|nr:hypothetical protein IPA_05420 [Ignicoccus pacificus DSM 13166]
MSEGKIRITPRSVDFGAVAIELECSGYKISLDAGTEVSTEDVLLSHAHLDHSKMAVGKRIHATLPTLALARLLWIDSKKLDPEIPWEVRDVQLTLNNAHWINLHEEFKVGPFIIRTHEAGHVLGSVVFEIECKGKSIIYTGDLGSSSFLLNYWINDVPRGDYLIIESSYLCKDRPSQKTEWSKLFTFLKSTLPNSPVLIAANAVGKVQEVVKFLMNYSNNLPLERVVVEGMGVDATKIYDDMVNYLKDTEISSWLNGSRRMLMDFIEIPKTIGERKNMLTPGTVIVAPSGSLSGGMSVWWASHNIPYVLLGHVFEPASRLLEGQSVVVEDPLGNQVKLGPPSLHLQISRHASRQELFQFISKSEASEVFLFHGDEECLFTASSEYDFTPLQPMKTIEL